MTRTTAGSIGEPGGARPVAPATVDRRGFLAGGGACFAALGLRGGSDGTGEDGASPRLDRVFAANADVLPERPGAGANHYPMAAEALEALGHADAIEEAWVDGAAGYAGGPLRRGPIGDPAGALGDYERHGDWLELFRDALASAPWRSVVAKWSGLLAPGLAAGTFHGVIRAGHAARALRRSDTPARRAELAAGLAYWAARYVELPTDPEAATSLDALAHPWLDEHEPVGFFEVLDRPLATPVAPPARLPATAVAARAELEACVREAAAAFLEMLVQERYRVWLLHTVTGPAAVDLLLPDVDEASARLLVAHARRATVALFAAYGAPFKPREHVRPAPRPWPELVDQAAATGSVHTVKLIDALVRLDRPDDPLHRSVAEQWLEWK